MPSKSSPLTIVAAFAAVTIAGSGLLFAQHLTRPGNRTKPVATRDAANTTANRPQPRDLGPPPPGPRTATGAVESGAPSAKILRESATPTGDPALPSDDAAQTARASLEPPQVERNTSPFAAATESPVDTTGESPAPAPAMGAASVDTAGVTPPVRAPARPWWDYSAAPIFVPVETGNPLGTPGTRTLGTSGTSTLGTSGTSTLGTSGTSTLGTSGTSTVGTNTTRAVVPRPSR